MTKIQKIPESVQITRFDFLHITATDGTEGLDTAKQEITNAFHAALTSPAKPILRTDSVNFRKRGAFRRPFDPYRIRNRRCL